MDVIGSPIPVGNSYVINTVTLEELFVIVRNPTGAGITYTFTITISTESIIVANAIVLAAGAQSIVHLSKRLGLTGAAAGGGAFSALLPLGDTLQITSGGGNFAGAWSALRLTR